jgi:hypothetical protein
MMYEITQYIGIGIIGTGLWLGFEIWRAPLMEEQPDGSWKTIKPAKKLSDLFKRKK